MGLAETQAFYNKWAREYDWLCRLLPGLRRLRGAAVDALSLSPGDTVVDLGCGTGANLPYLREHVGNDGQVIGVDLTPGMLAEAEQRVEREDWQNVHIIRADAARPPVDEVDAIFGSFVVGMLSDPEQAVEGWVDCLAPGGYAGFLEAGRSNHNISRGLNPVFDTFVAAGSASDDNSPSKRLDEKIDGARGTLSNSTVVRHDERRVGGFVRIVAGQS